MSDISVETDKYYTPKIEEFHKGFEYQIVEYASLDGGPRKLQYIDKIYKGSEYHTVDVGIEYNKIKCKFLDRKDIESLGFKPDFERTWGERMCFRNNIVALTYVPQDNWIRVYFKEKEPVKLEEVRGRYCDFKIKNKSELKKLMEMLKIGEDE